MSFFAQIPEEPQDPIYGLQQVIQQDTRADKANVSIGILVHPDGSLQKFSSVELAEQELLHKESKAYLPIDGYTEFRQAISSLLLAKHANSYTAQTVGGTGALYLAAKFLHKFGAKDILVSNPTWVNHKKLFESVGLTVHTYPHAANEDGTLNLHPILEAIKKCPKHSIILLQASCHNPTGLDPSLEQWQQLSLQILEHKLIPIFDLAYHGLGKGLAEDSLAIELFAHDGHDLLIAMSMAKNFGIYSDRVGALTIATHSPLTPIISQLKKIIRTTYSSPPAHGARVVAHILNSPVLRKMWEEELATTRAYITSNRNLFYQRLIDADLSTLALAVKNSTGLFALLPLSQEKIMQLRDRGIYLMIDGRINIAALNATNIDAIIHTLC